MSFTPAHISAVRGPRGKFQNSDQAQWKENVNKIRQLYQARKYKQCAAICVEILKINAARPLYEAFLQYYVGICNESLGISAHNYSSNKLHFLMLSRDHLASALVTLPIPYCSSKSGQYDSRKDISPQWVTDVFSDSSSTTTPPQFSEDDEGSSDTASATSDYEYTNSVPDFNKYKPRGMAATPKQCLLTPERKARFSDSLGTTHIIQEEPIPKPIFVEKKAAFDYPLSVLSHHSPSLRKTDLPIHQIPRIDESPITPRFKEIRAIFTPKPNQEHLNAYLTSAPLTRYNILLASFRTQLLAQIAIVNQNIAVTTKLQDAHKRNKYSRLASFWSVKEEGVVAMEKKARIDRLRGEGWRVRKERHGWKGVAYYQELRERALKEVHM